MATIRINYKVPDGECCKGCRGYKELSGLCLIFGEYLSGDFPSYRRCDKCKKAEIKKPEKLLPCKCGCNRREKWFGVDNEFYKCKKCGYLSNCYPNDAALRKGWNNEMRALKEEGKTL